MVAKPYTINIIATLIEQQSVKINEGNIKCFEEYWFQI